MSIEYGLSLAIIGSGRRVEVDGGGLSHLDVMLATAIEELAERYGPTDQDLRLQLWASEDGEERELNEIEWGAFHAAEEQVFGRRLVPALPPVDEGDGK